jgi:chromosome segregation ATPase
MLEAFESGNYKRIQEALQDNTNLKERLMAQIQEIDNELQIEMARKGEEKNEAYIKYLQEWRQKLTSSTEIFQADLELLIEQEQKQLDIYKEYLQKQQEQLEESLEKRKEAYEEYFDSINQQQADIDYEEERTRLISSITKLATSTDASSQKQMAELKDRLLEMEKERQKELRERAQEALIEGLDKNVEEINEKFDKLLSNEGLLLQSMNKDMASNPNLLSDILYSAVSDGQLTRLNATQYAQDLVAAFSSTGLDTSDINEFMSSIQNNATFNLSNGQTVNLESDDAAMLWAAIQSIMIKKGYGN